MATGNDYASLMRRYTPHNLLEAMVKRFSYFWNKVKKDRTWGLGQQYDVPYETGEFSNLEFGALTDSAKITGNQQVLGVISKHPELWGAIKIKERDMDFDNLEHSFMKIMPGKLRRFGARHAEVVSLILSRGNKLCSMVPVADGGVDPVLNDGVVYVKDAHFLEIGQRVYVNDDVKTAFEAYVKNIELDAVLSGDVAKGDKVTLTSDLALATVIDFTAAGVQVTEANNGYITIPGAQTASNAFTSFKDILLPASLGGSDTIYGDNKVDAPFLQPHKIKGSTIDDTNIGERVLDAVFDVQRRAKGSMKKDILVSYKNFGSIIKTEESNRRYQLGEARVEYGFSVVEMIGPRGRVSVVAVPEMEDENMYIVDWDAFRFAGSNFFNAKRQDGSIYFKERATSGYSYITDVRFFGDLICTQPSHNGVIYDVSY